MVVALEQACNIKKDMLFMTRHQSGNWCGKEWSPRRIGMLLLVIPMDLVSFPHQLLQPDLEAASVEPHL